jgi:Ca2+/Na+ antiporter
VHYLSEYYCTKTALRPAVFVGLLLWLVFLFSTLGISASDFFTPNLATIAQLLGLDENVAGVTFLAFGNGSPDVFSTFSAMRANSGSLAIGELLGAASFIVSCVVGSMCIIKPFRVHPKPFLRDVGFFTVAVSLLLVILWDGQIYAWEAGILIALYAVYVIVVVVGSWWDRRQEKTRRVEALIRDEYEEEEVPLPPVFEEYRDDRKWAFRNILYICNLRPRSFSVRQYSNFGRPDTNQNPCGIKSRAASSGHTNRTSSAPPFTNALADTITCPFPTSLTNAIIFASRRTRVPASRGISTT